MPVPLVAAAMTGVKFLATNPAAQKALLKAGGKMLPGLIEGGVSAFQANRQLKEAQQREQTAQQAFDQSKAAYFAQDVSNPYANMENVYEDLTINQQQADFTAQQQAQGQANIMQSLRGAAGPSGIAALAQSLANQQAQNAQAASASIGAQEANIQQLRAGEAGRLQNLTREGEVYSRELKADLMGTQLGMDMADLTAAREQAIAGRENMASAIGGIGNTIMGGVDSYFGDLATARAKGQITPVNKPKYDGGF